MLVLENFVIQNERSGESERVKYGAEIAQSV
jgi:hypothetical protein